MHLINASRIFNDCNVNFLDVEAQFQIQLQLIMGTTVLFIMFTIIAGWMLSMWSRFLANPSLHVTHKKSILLISSNQQRIHVSFIKIVMIFEFTTVSIHEAKLFWQDTNRTLKNYKNITPN